MLTAVLWSSLSASVFVLNLYWKVPELIQSKPRNDPGVIRFRMMRVLYASALAVLLTAIWLVVSDNEIYAERTFLGWIGFDLQFGTTMSACFNCLLLTAILFLGPLVQVVVNQEPFLSAKWNSLEFWRNYIVSPFAEELVYRACCLVPLIGVGLSISELVFYSPLLFGIAHSHHAWEKRRFTTVSVRSIILSTAFQFAYTTIFGWYAAYLYLATGQLAAVVLVHSFCNIMGFPDLGVFLDRENYKLWQRSVIITAYLLGVTMFYLLFSTLAGIGLYSSSFRHIIEFHAF